MNKPRTIVVTLSPEISEDNLDKVLMAISMLQNVVEVRLPAKK